MANLDMICIRFHYGGWFETVGANVYYLGGDIAKSWIDVDKLSYFEIKGHLEDHYRTDHVIRFYWLKPHMDMMSGLVLLVDDASCQVMLQAHTATGTYPEGLVVDMYTENVGTELAADDQEIWTANDDDDLQAEAVEVLPVEDEGDGNAGDEASADSAGDEASADNADSAEDANAGGSMSWMDDKDYRSFCAFYKSPSKPTVVVAETGRERGRVMGGEEESKPLSRAERERNRGANGVFEGCRLTSGPRLPATQRSPCIASLRHGVQTTDMLAASVAKPPSQTAQGVRCLVLQTLECRKPGFILGGLG
jgi:hypothetical protein